MADADDAHFMAAPGQGVGFAHQARVVTGMSRSNQADAHVVLKSS
jgi:hypothetical protein